MEKFAKDFAPKAKNRLVISEMKRKMNWQAIKICETEALGPHDMESLMKVHKTLNKKNIRSAAKL